MNTKTSLLTRITRIAKLAWWLFSAAKRIGKLDEDASQTKRDALLSLLGKEALAVLNIRLNVTGNSSNQNGMLVVANHVSWLDIFVIAALEPSSFIAKKEISKWLIIGRLAKNVGTVFIDRSARKDVDSIVKAIVEALRKQQNICFFPEAKTSDGMGLLPFKAALFQAAIDAPAPVQAMALRYYDETGTRSTIPSYVGQTNLLTSLWKIVSMPEIEIRVDFMPLFKPSEDRYLAKEHAEQIIGNIVLSDLKTEL